MPEASQHQTNPSLSLPSARNRLSASPTKNGPVRQPSFDAPMLSASSSNNHTLFSFGPRSGASDDATGEPTGSFDFLPSVSFDDLQSSLESASTDFKLTQFPSPTGQGSILGDEGLSETMVERPNVTRNGGTTRVTIQQPPATRPSRTGSILRRPSITSNRQASTSTVASTNSSAPLNAPTAPAAMRPRRQSHYPPVSNSNIAKPPRKSVGPGVYEYDGENRPTQRRRPSVASLSDRSGIPGSNRSSIDGGSRLGGDTTRNLTGSRASKARSVQPPPRLHQATLAADNNNSSLTPDQSRTSISFPRSPQPSIRSVNTQQQPGSGTKRTSAMPSSPHVTHATGLGARTISPTDTRRMKRLSLHHSQSHSRVIDLPPPPPAADIRSASRSPSMLPRKTSTPSSSRTTPDLNRKSYSSGFSVGSTTSGNTVRTSTGSLQPRLPQGGSSRLPAPKSLTLHNPPPAEDDEDVPPVPAIPKVYESPKDSPAELSFLDKRRSNLAFDASSIHSNSTGSISGHGSTETTSKPQRKASARKSVHASKLEIEKKAAASQGRKNLQPLRLPPITLGPLSTPTAAKIAALQDQGSSSERHLSPPPTRQMAKTPSTPMTASKSSFFSRNRPDDRSTLPNLRSSSSIHHARSSSPTAADNTSSSESIVGAGSKHAPQRSGMSPFLSSSLPKGGNMESAFAKRSKTGGDLTLPLDSVGDYSVHKPQGPRAQKPKTTATTTKPAAKSPPPLSSPEEPPTPSSMSSIRRKLSLTFKRSASKNGGRQPNGEKTEGNLPKQDSMPPPRIPHSATANGFSSKPSSPTPSTKSTGTGTYLESRRRKSSTSSINAVIAQERSRGDSLTGVKRESGLDTVMERSNLSHNASVVQKILKPKASTSTVRSHDVWTSELDKDDMAAEEEMKKLGSRRKETEMAARTLDALRKRATPKERVSSQDAIRIAMLNVYERGEIVDYKDIYFCGTQNAAKVVGDLHSGSPNFGYDDERGDYTIVPGDHLAYRYEIIDILGKGSFGQVVRCIDHKTGVLVAVKIIRNKKRFHQQALVEVNILQKLREWVSSARRRRPATSAHIIIAFHVCRGGRKLG